MEVAMLQTENTNAQILRPCFANACKTMIVIPAYNEEERLNTQAFVDFIDAFPEVHFAFVNDGSRDNTLEVLGKLHDARPANVTVLSLTQNSGKAEAVRQGLIYAAKRDVEFVGYWDADLATPLEAIVDFIRVGQRYTSLQVVYGSRRQMAGHKIERKLSRRVVSNICSTMAGVAVGLPIADTQCGAKLIRKSDALDAALAKPFTAGWLFDVELFSRMAEQLDDPMSAFYEFPLSEWTEVPGSKVSADAILKSGVVMLGLIQRRLVGGAEMEIPESKVGTQIVHTTEALEWAA
jgi:dolichyl-phosphate beta-glucosyltransferase